MLDLKFIRENVDLVRQAIANKREDVNLDRLLELDERRRAILAEGEALKAQRNKVSETIASMKKRGEDASALIQEMGKVADRIKELDGQLDDLAKAIYEVQIRIPNVPHPSVPIGDESANVVIKHWGTVETFDFQPKTHWEIGESLGILDLAGGAKVAGAFFVNFRGLGAKLERALINFMLDLHVQKHGYTEVFPPFVTKRESMFGTGQIPKLEKDMYRIEEDDLFL
ncbi:MAG: serine--tRNA ligase, partial [Calditrichaeota bacterium]|nr:serine--tRNA ligase [Calditrichota bacterium]